MRVGGGTSNPRSSLRTLPREQVPGLSVGDTSAGPSSRLRKVFPTLHPSFIVRGGWAWRGKVAEDLYRAVQSLGRGPASPLKTRYDANWSPSWGQQLPSIGPLAIDLETVKGKFKIVQGNWSSEEGTGAAARWTEEVREAFGEALRQQRLVVMHNAQFDEEQLYEDGIKVVGPIWDTMIAAAVLEPDLPNNLEHVAKDFTDILPWKHLSGEDLATYGCIDADATFRCYLRMKEALRAEGVERVFETSMEVLPLLIEMKRIGLKVSSEGMEKSKTICEAYEEDARRELDSVVRGLQQRSERRSGLLLEAGGKRDKAEGLREEGKKGEARKLELEAQRMEKEAAGLWGVNWSSQQQLLGVLDELGLPRKKHLKTGEATTDAATIQELARQTGHRFLIRLLDYRESNKLRTTFYNQELGDDGKIHPTYLLHRDYDIEGGMEGACTGRLASKAPNIQNWPREARAIVIPDFPEWELMEADYEQIEFRIIAYKAGGRLWKAVNTEGFDIHSLVASKIYNRPAESIRKGSPERDIGKRSVYAGAYGVGPLKFSRALAADGIFVPVAECRKILAAYRSLFPESQYAQRRFVEEAFQTNKVRNPFGRFRRFYKPTDETTAIYNIYPQSTAGDIILRAMSGLRSALPTPARIAVQVHDSLLIGYPREMRKEVGECVKETMEEVVPEMPGFLPRVGLKIGKSWGELKPVEGTL